MSARAILDAEISEKDFQQQVLDTARALGWRCFHTFDSRRSEQGFPDLCCVKDGPRGARLIFAELKAQGGKLSDHQVMWLGELRQVAYDRGIEVYEWKPEQWDGIERTLR